jgi:hypothetical protein
VGAAGADAKREFTKSGDGPRCRWCGRLLPPRSGPGRRREFCGDSCRQLDYQNRRRAADAGLGDDQVIVARAEIDALHDQLYLLAAAVEDVDHDLTDARTVADHREAVEHLLEAARPLAAVRFPASGVT